VKYTLYQYRTNQVSGLDYVKDHFLDENGGEVEEVEIYPKRFLYAIKRALKDYNDIEYTEFKVYDLDNPYNSCVDKKIDYSDEVPTAREYYDKLMKYNSEFKNYVSSRIEFGD